MKPEEYTPLTDEEKRLLKDFHQYLETLNITLAIPQEVYKCKKRCKELLKIAEDLDERLKQ